MEKLTVLQVFLIKEGLHLLIKDYEFKIENLKKRNEDYSYWNERLLTAEKTLKEMYNYKYE